MKKLISLFYFTLIISSLTAQKCLNINITPMMSGLNSPGSCASSFSDCTTKTNDHGQTEITGYGGDLAQLDTLTTRTMRDLTMASVSNINGSMSSPQNPDQAKQLADKLKSMTPEQQKQWAMQMAQQNQQQYVNASAIHDDATTSKLVMQTNDMAVNQLSALNREFAAKLRDVMDASSKEVNAVKSPDITTCAPTKPVGLPTCKCANDLDSKYWQQIISIKDKYNSQRVALLQNYLPKIKAITTTVDYNISKLNYGDAVKTPQFKKMLFGAQSSAFGNAFSITLACIEDIRKDGSNTFVHKVNADKNVEDLSCAK
ncbi:MAG TPA: hypothetical protein VHZ50_16610 [Puia sp.]|nr:hypothetical protein [Puia sp.]